MLATRGQSVEVFRVHPVTLWSTLFLSLLLQAFLPVKVPWARLIDFPLLATVYFAMVRRNKLFAIGMGTGIGLLQDALSHSYLGIYGMAKALVAYMATALSLRFNLEPLIARSVLMGVFVLIHNLFLAGLQHALLENPPPFLPLEMASGLLVNIALGLIVFQVLDRFRHPA